MAAFFFKWLLLTALWLPAPEHAITPRHPFYIGVTEISHNATDRSLEITCKLFSDDLEEQLEKNYKTTLDIVSGKDKVQFDKFISDYIAKHLSLSVDGKSVALNYVGYEAEKGFAYCYFEVAGVSSAKKLDVSNNILYDFKTEHVNIIHANVGGNRKSSRLAYPESKASFTF